MRIIAVHNSTYLERPEGSKAMPDKGECWGVGPCTQWEKLPWVHVKESAGVLVQVISLCPVEGATMGACEGECWGVSTHGLPCEGECWGVSSGGLPVSSCVHPLPHIMQR